MTSQEKALEIYKTLPDRTNSTASTLSIIIDALAELSKQVPQSFLNANPLNMGVGYWDTIYHVCHLVIFGKPAEIIDISHIPIPERVSTGYIYMRDRAAEKRVSNITRLHFDLYYPTIVSHLMRINDNAKPNYSGFHEIFKLVINAYKALLGAQLSIPIIEMTRLWINHVYGLATTEKSKFGLLHGVNLADLVIEFSREFMSCLVIEFRSSIICVNTDVILLREYDKISHSLNEFIKSYNIDGLTYKTKDYKVGICFDIRRHILLNDDKPEIKGFKLFDPDKF